jgi:hypothetical protein
MFRITRTAGLAVLAILAVAAAVLTGSIQAATIDQDSVPTIGTSSFELDNGTVYWQFANGRYDAHLTGTLRLDNANGSCARVHGGTVCAPDGNAHQ